jgi:predicted site-specific integrase-resolvase
MLSLNQAAKQGKVAKTSLLTALKNGDISGTKSENGHWQIEKSELLRWIGSRSSKPRENDSENVSDHPEKPGKTSALERDVELLRQRVDDKDDVIRDLRERLDRETEERMRLTALLADQRPREDRDQQPAAKTDVGQKAEKRERRSLGQILFGFPPRQR